MRWERRFEDWPFEQPSYSIDGIDCPIWTVDARRRERPDGRGGPNGSGSFVSHKFRHDALRYLVCLHMCLPIIVAAGGGYPAGHYVDLRIAQNDIVPLMGANERGNADGGYQDGFTHFMTPFRVNARARRQIDDLTMAAYHEAHQHVRARQEHINAELKEWKVLRETFRHDPQFHPTVFHAIVQLTQLRLETQPSILVAPLYAAVIHQGNVGILQFNKDGTVANSCQL